MTDLEIPPLVQADLLCAALAAWAKLLHAEPPKHARWEVNERCLEELTPPIDKGCS